MTRPTNTMSDAPVPGTIGALERLAGIGPDEESRFRFWIAFRNSADPIADGLAELRRRIATHQD